MVSCQLSIGGRAALLSALVAMAILCLAAASGCQDTAPPGPDAGAVDVLTAAQDGAMAGSDVTDTAGIDTDVPNQSDNGKPYCKGSWMCSAAKCTHVLDGQPGIGKYIPYFNLLREKDGSAPGIMAATFYRQVPGGSKTDQWDLVTVETALMELRADGEFRYLSNAFPGVGYGFPARTATGVLAMASAVSQTNEPADPHELGYGQSDDMLVVSRVAQDKSLVNVAALGEWYPVYFRGADSGSIVELVAEPAVDAGTVESSQGPRVFVIDVESAVVKVEKKFLGGKKKRNHNHGSIIPTADYPAWGIANLAGQRVMHEWVRLSDGKVAFSVSKLDENFEVISKSADTLGANVNGSWGPDVDQVGDKLYIASMFGGNWNLATVTADGVVEHHNLKLTEHQFPGISVLPTTSGGRILSANGAQIYGTASDGTVLWKLNFGDPFPSKSDDPFSGKRKWPDWYVNDGEDKRSTVDFHPSRPKLFSLGNGRFAHAYQMDPNPIANPSPFDPDNPPRAANIAPFYLLYFDENGKLLCN